MTTKSQIHTPQRIILFDGVCNLCNASVNFIIDRDPKQKFKFAALQSDLGQLFLIQNNFDTQKFDSIVLVENGKVFQKSTAALRIAKELKGAWGILYYAFIWIPPFVRNIFYNLIAKYRYVFFGKSESCRMPTPELKARFL